ncbi:MAG: selenide, water dikinase SelD, partial [Bacteroidetes bacterium]|nr:selenide, water dikinase SelD [Bacteroidota bacterium]
LNAEDLKIAMQWMKTLNKAGQILGELKYVKAMTDVTGFGLGGHLLEICESSNINAEINFSAIPLINGLNKYIEQKTIPGGTNRNFESYGLKISTMTDYIKTIICDPQTSGGLLLIVEEEKQNEVLKIALENNFFIKQIGKTFKRNNDENGCYLFIK